MLTAKSAKEIAEQADQRYKTLGERWNATARLLMEAQADVLKELQDDVCPGIDMADVILDKLVLIRPEIVKLEGK